ncbi:MAG: phosphonate ABC transporter ATP-binding protein [Alphaproteobacteria bacterium]|nr:phosphonate ABC transporter ATP-binding protein [Alphaproteobacteria bacterium]
MTSSAQLRGVEGQHHPMLSFHGLTKQYPDGVKALDEVTFSVPRGEFCVILGPSGAGKSTLLKTLNGLAEPSSGKVVFDGEEVSRRTLRRVQKRVATVHQQFNLVERLNVAQNVLSGAIADATLLQVMLQWYPHSFRQKACDLVARVGLEPVHLARRMGELSGGQQQRVGIARAFILDPDVILADEPVASLDPATSRDVLTLLHDAARERGTTVLCSLHQVDMGLSFADRVIAMRRGRIVFDGHPDAITDAELAQIYEGSDEDRRLAA